MLTTQLLHTDAHAQVRAPRSNGAFNALGSGLGGGGHASTGSENAIALRGAALYSSLQAFNEHELVRSASCQKLCHGLFTVQDG